MSIFHIKLHTWIFFLGGIGIACTAAFWPETHGLTLWLAFKGFLVLGLFALFLE